MDYIARRGFDAYALDLRGYGMSGRPHEMDMPADQNPPVVRGDTALRDIAAAVDFIRKRRDLASICLVGWSWGTTLTGTYASRHPDSVARLVLYAPLWVRRPDQRVDMPAGHALPAYRTVIQSDARARWLNGVPDNERASLIPEGWFETWAQATWATDPQSALSDPARLRAPNGVIEDVMEYYNAGRAYYDPAAISVPTLVVTPEWDNDTPPYMADELWSLLPRTPGNKLARLAKGTHTMLMEKNRESLFAEVQSFLEREPTF